MIPYSENEITSYVHRLKTLDEHDVHALHQLMNRAVQGHVTPGVRLWVGVDPQSDGSWAAEFERGVGHLSYEASSPATTTDTLYDLASLTKPLATALWCGVLISQELLDPNRPIGEIISCDDPMLSQTPVWRLLNHSSGLPAHCAYYHGLGGARLAGAPPERCRQTVRRMISATATQIIPGERSIYSDLGYLLLEYVCERISGQTIDEFWSTLSVPSSLHFRPLDALNSKNSDHSTLNSNLVYAPTERCPWRKRILSGEVHDDNAWLIGGACGHAGLFGTAKGVGHWAGIWMSAFHGQHTAIPLSPQVVQWMFQLTHRAPQRSSFVLGWDTPSVGYSSAGQGFGRFCVGHLGFTGTSLWMDLESRVAMVLLTNRVHLDRHTPSSVQGIRWLRPQIHNEVWRLLRA